MPRDQLTKQLDDLAGRLGQEFQLDCEWVSDDCLDFRRSGLDGQIDIGDGEIEMMVRLGMFMDFFRSKIESEILAFIEEHIY